MIIDGKIISQKIKSEIKDEILNLNKIGITPGLAVILVGDDPSSQIYVNNKRKICKEVGIYSEEYTLPENTSQSEVIDLVKKLNNNSHINGILIQMPLPPHINAFEVTSAVSPLKDVDAFHPENIGKMISGNGLLIPCTPAGIIEMLNFEKIQIEGKNCVVIGRSDIVGKPMAYLLIQKNGTVTVCHSKTKNLKEICQKADIIISAVGNPNFLTSDMVKEGATVIDVGINRNKNGSICGDVDFETVKNVAQYITPVPGGVGPMTIAMLMKNTLTAAKLQNGLIK